MIMLEIVGVFVGIIPAFRANEPFGRFLHGDKLIRNLDLCRGLVGGPEVFVVRRPCPELCIAVSADNHPVCFENKSRNTVLCGRNLQNGIL